MGDGFELTRIGGADLDRLAAADPRLATDPAHAAHLAGLLSAGVGWAAIADDAVAGFAVVTRRFFGFQFVDLLVVAEPARRRGLGEALMAACEADHEADRIFTSTNESNAPMRRLLAKNDWLTAGLIEYLDPGDPELVFVKFRA